MELRYNSPLQACLPSELTTRLPHLKERAARRSSLGGRSGGSATPPMRGDPCRPAWIHRPGSTLLNVVLLYAPAFTSARNVAVVLGACRPKRPAAVWWACVGDPSAVWSQWPGLCLVQAAFDKRGPPCRRASGARSGTQNIATSQIGRARGGREWLGTDPL